MKCDHYREWSTTLEIRNPLAVCGDCNFATELQGTWSVEDGRLVFRADPDPQPRRGPDLEGCNESYEVVHFRHVTLDERNLSEKEFETLKDSARACRAIGK